MLDSTKGSEGPKPSRYKKRCSDKGVLPLSNLDYLQLLDLTARMQRSDKRGYTPRDLPPLLERLGIDTERWRLLTKDFGRRDTTVVGTQLFIVSPAIGGDAWRVGICLNINVS